MWGGNNSAIDILVKPDSVEKVRRVLNDEHIRFDIAIEDLQQAIDEENPPLEEEDFDNRNGKIFMLFLFNRGIFSSVTLQHLNINCANTAKFNLQNFIEVS